MAKTSMNMEENVASALCYLFGWVTGLIFFLLEKDNKVVRFHAMQSIIVFGALSIVGIVPFIWTISWLIGILGFVLWLILIIKAYQGGIYKLPLAGDLAESWSK